MDNPCGFHPDQFLACLKQYGPVLSAHEVAALCKVSVRQVLCCQHHNDWTIQAIAGDWRGFKYQKRETLDVKNRALREVGVYEDQGISKRSPKAVTP